MFHPLPEELRDIAGQPFPLYPCSNESWSIKPTAGRSSSRVMICSIPKAGTHLYARLLGLLGLVQSDVFFNKDYLGDFRFVDVERARFTHSENILWIPIEISSRFIQPGQFGYGHLPCDIGTRHCLADFKIVFLSREMRAAIVSQMRYVGDSDWCPPERAEITWRNEPDGPDKMLKYFDEIAPFIFNDRCHPVAPWADQENVLGLSYEQIIGDQGREVQFETIRRIVEFCEIERPPQPELILNQLIGQQTFTLSSGRTSWEACWNAEIEARFTALGGTRLNERFGFGSR
ncbi:MAG: hypothetical protein EOS23_13700 [Mesorhizobium sp.]|uniref:sulfotransferase domain-containing protein n=1 Tax=unclassified Mesorhizobium TaxID=325217 RepID=UPI000F75B1D9|nr:MULTISPECIES: sulfotransferase domain-containing protein [unclassified Mesorhizobium]RVC64802.1 hypothetical protein EN779_00600 [Mesorhizobium sp. M4B.F.Ca.ET.088.02.2.1]RVD74154.1 hypothetical protein EN751_01090 [Mesorhizobium sp. M4A.F.Ca.ET.029.04.2.1]AZN98149.1 hypothetical protein EJ066_13560 [Mesorhizobium sp. M9A.F.Ca.ET.002.03.1.2]MCP9233432.1 sulfotransferase domain-containing protein [Mesorhizobium sp. LMG 17147]RUV29641.1 hypothetical protein EOA86_14630 [Mesorhizobium sp. M5C.